MDDAAKLEARIKYRNTRFCTECKVVCLYGKPDPCLGELPGVTSACCGHGFSRGYLIFSNGTRIFLDSFAVDKFKLK